MLSTEAMELHRGINSLIEELEAVNWYNQRADVTVDEELKATVIHNRNEEIEHAAMLIEWLRRRVPEFAEELQTYLFTDMPITAVEEAEEADADEEPEGDEGGSDDSLGIRSMR
jgi:hypothetical protein